MLLSTRKSDARNLLTCPICFGPLSDGSGGVECRECTVRYAYDGGVVLLGPPFVVNGSNGSAETVFTERMRRLAGDAAAHGWEEARARFANEVLLGGLPEPTRSRWARARAMVTRENWEDTLQDLVDPASAGWKLLIDLRRASRVCFLGPSLGAAPLSLAQSCAHVVVLDGSVERLELVRQQSLGAGLDNLTFARVSDPLHLPLARGSVDLVVVPGLAEWFEAVGGNRPLPTTCGGDLLGELRRVIRPSGQIYLGTDNRYGLSRVLGSRRAAGTSFSGKTLRKAASDAGLEGCELFTPFPFRHKFHQIIDVGRTDRMNFCADPYRTRGRVLRPLVKLWDRWNQNGDIERRIYPFLPGLTAVLSVDPTPSSFAERLLRHVGDVAHVPPQACRLSRYYVRAKGAVVLAGGDPAVGGMMVRVPLAASAEASCRRQHRTIEMLARDERIPVSVRRLFPAPLAQGQFEGQGFFAETTLSGEVGRLYYSRPERRFDRAIVNAAEVLRQLRRSTEQPTCIQEAEFRRVCGAWLEELRQVVNGESRAALETIESVLRLALVGTTLPLGWYHGDYDFANLLYGPDDSVTGILDFEVFEPLGLPLIDFMVLLARRPIRQQGFAFGTLFVRSILERKLPPLEAELLEREMRTLGVDEWLYRALALCCWLNHLRLRRDSWLVRSPSWLDENLHTVIDSIRRVL